MKLYIDVAVVYFLMTESNLGFVDVVSRSSKVLTANSPLPTILVYLAFETEIEAAYFSSYEPFETNDVIEKIKKKKNTQKKVILVQKYSYILNISVKM